MMDWKLHLSLLDYRGRTKWLRRIVKEELQVRRLPDDCQQASEYFYILISAFLQVGMLLSCEVAYVKSRFGRIGPLHGEP